MLRICLLLSGCALLLALAGLTIADEPAPVADDYLLTKWDQDDGLPGNTVSALRQGRDGYLWIGTYSGLARFDGMHFVAFPAGNSGLPSGRIRSLAKDPAGALWIGMDAGTVVRESAGVFSVILQPAGAPDEWLTSMACDGRGRIWAGLSRLRARRWDAGLAVDLGRSDGLIGEGGVSLAADAAGKIWFTTEDSYGYVEDDKAVTLAADASFPQLCPRVAGGFWLIRGNVLLIRNDQQQLLYGAEVPWRGGTTEVQVLFEDRKGALWIGTKGQGLFRFDGEFARVPTGHNYILSVTEDSEGNVWAGTLGGGLVRLHPKRIRLHEGKNGLPADVIDAVCEDGQGGLWFAARNAGPVRYIAGKYTLFTAADGWNGGFVTTLCADGAGGAWLGTLAEGLIHWSRGEFSVAGLKGERIHALFQDRQGNLWVGTDRGLIVWRGGKGTTPPGIPDHGAVTAMTEDPGNQIWIGTDRGELLHFDGKTWGKTNPGGADQGAAIHAIHCDEPGKVWLGTSAGLFRIVNGQVSRVTEAQGLPNDDVRQIVREGDDLWIGSARGLFRVPVQRLEEAIAAGRNLTKEECTIFGRDDGLGSIEFAEGNGNGLCRSKDGRLWFATRRGVAEVNPAEVKDVAFRPPVHIESVLIDDRAQTLDPTDPQVTVPPLARKVEIRYAAVALSLPEKLHFRYRLNPSDERWTDAGTNRAAIFHGIAPGHYRFMVQGGVGEFAAESSNSSLSNASRAGVASLEFRVLPALRQRAWFQVLWAGATLAVAGFGVRRWTLQRVRRRVQVLEREQALEAERARIARDMHDELGASLTSISLLSEQVRAGAAGLPNEMATRIEKISKAANAVSRTLDEIVWTVNPRNDTLDGLIGYIGEYAAEFLAPTGIRLSLDLPVEVPALPLSSEVRHHLLLVVKEALNNAVKSSSANEIAIHATCNDGTLRFEIADDGKGFQLGVNGHGADGLGNMRQRLVAAGGKCEIQSTPGTGTRVRATLPLPRTLSS